MKTKLIIAGLLFSCFTACSPRYQVYDISSEEVLEQTDDIYLYEGEDLAITYDFWVEGGVMFFEIYNQLDRTIYIDLGRSQFIVNNVASPYFEYRPNLPPTSNPNQLQTLLTIEAQQSQTLEGFPINYHWKRIRKKDNPQYFEATDSPFLFKNKLVYAFDPALTSPKTVENEFWVAEITQLKKGDFETYTAVETAQSDKFYVVRRSNSHDTFFWLDLTLSILEILVLF